MLKSKFLAGVLATLITLIFLVGLSILLVFVFDVNASKNWFTYTAAFLTIAVWGGTYSWLKPKPPTENQEDNRYDNDSLPPRHS